MKTRILVYKFCIYCGGKNIYFDGTEEYFCQDCDRGWTGEDNSSSRIRTGREFNLNYDFVIDSQALSALLDHVGMPEEYRDDITGAMVIQSDGDYIDIWLTESSSPYDLGAIFEPLNYYFPEDESK